jgi:hypothetical protein
LCYTFNSGKNDKDILKATKTGSSFGLSMIINSQPEEYYGPYSREGTGFRVVIHDQDDYPSMEKNALQISPGSSVELKIIRKEVMEFCSLFFLPCFFVRSFVRLFGRYNIFADNHQPYSSFTA